MPRPILKDTSGLLVGGHWRSQIEGLFAWFRKFMDNNFFDLCEVIFFAVRG